MNLSLPLPPPLLSQQVSSHHSQDRTGTHQEEGNSSRRHSYLDSDPQALFAKLDKKKVLPSYQEITAILQKTQDQRNKRDLLKLDDYFQHNQFFKDLTQQQDKETTYHCYKVMQLQLFQPGQVVFNQGDMGSIFYIILQGEVGVIIPTPFEQQYTNEELFLYCMKNIDNIDWLKFNHGDQIRAEVRAEMHKLNLTVQNFEENYQKLQDKLKKKEITIPYGVTSLFDQKKPGYVKFWVFNEVAKLGEGKSFGELALITSQPRAATIKSNKDTEFAILEKKDYESIMGNTKKRQMNDKVKFFKNFRIFSTLSKNKMQKMIYYFHERIYHRNQTIYTEGLDKIDGVYFIKSGEFEVSQKVKLEKQTNPDYEISKYTNSNKQQIKNNNFLINMNAKTDISLKKSTLYLLGSHEVFGLEEILENLPRRKVTIKCSLNNSVIYYIKKEDFVNCVNLFKFSEKLIQEKFIKQTLFSQRVNETQNFRKVQVSEMEQHFKNEKLEKEMQQIFSINIKKEFSQKTFQNATNKIIKDKKTLVFDPVQLNNNLKTLRMRGEQDKLKDFEIQDNPGHSPVQTFLRAPQLKEQHSPEMKTINKSSRMAQILEFDQQNVTNNSFRSYGKGKNSKLSHRNIKDEDIKNKPLITQSLQSLHQSNHKMPPLQQYDQCTSPLDNIDEIVYHHPHEIEIRLPNKNSSQVQDPFIIHHNPDNFFHKRQKSHVVINKEKHLSSHKQNNFVQRSKILKTQSNIDEGVRNGLMSIQSLAQSTLDLHNYQDQQINPKILKTMVNSEKEKYNYAIKTKRPSTISQWRERQIQKMKTQQKNGKFQQNLVYQDQQNDEFYMNYQIVPQQQVYKQTLKKSPKQQHQNCNTCVFCRKQLSRRLINRPASKLDIKIKNEKERIISFREGLIQQFKHQEMKLVPTTLHKSERQLDHLVSVLDCWGQNF